MQLTSLSTIKSLLKKYNIHPRKHLGQNFLISRNILEKIIEAADLSKDDVALEIGPGIGVLTLELAKKAKKVIAIEKDPEMVKIVRNVLTVLNVKNVEIIGGNILKLQTTNYQLPTNYKVVANIPYYITSPVIRMFLEAENKPELIVLMVQKEVGQRICARPPKMSVLSVSVQFYAQPEIISYVSKKSFWPQPKVDSAILRISPFDFAQGKQINTNLAQISPFGSAQGRQIDTNLFFEIVKAGFSSKRKFLLNNLSRVLKEDKKEIEKIFSLAKISPKSRAENLDVKDWVKVYNQYKKYLSTP